MDIKKGLLDLYNEMQYTGQRLTQGWRFGRTSILPGGWPIMMGISFPKSGTNLLRQVLAAYARVAPLADRSFDVFAAYNAETGKASTIEDAMRFLAALRPGDIAAAHFFAWPEVAKEVCGKRYITFFIYRDPRDVVVSHVFYVTKMAPEHSHHQYYAEVLQNFDERLKTSILGRTDVHDFPDIRRRFEPYLAWLDHPEVLSLRYEDLILDRQGSLGKVYEHVARRLELPVSHDEMVSLMEKSISPEKSPTFRSGRTGEWNEHFSEDHKKLFKDVSGDLLIKLGYESGYEW